MPVAGARALLTATRLDAVSASHIARALSGRFPITNNRLPLGSRTLRTSSANQAKPSNDPNTTSSPEDQSPAKPSTSDITSTETADEHARSSATEATAQSPPLGQKEVTPRSQGHGSFRSRALRGRAVEEFPAVKIPPWFTRSRVQLEGAEERYTRVSKLPEADLLVTITHIQAVIVGVKESLLNIDTRHPGMDPVRRMEMIVSKTELLRSLMAYLILTVAYHSDVEPQMLLQLQKVVKDVPRIPTSTTGPTYLSILWSEATEKSEGLERGLAWLESLRPDIVREEPGLWGMPTPTNKTELAAHLELVKRAKRELAAVAPRQKASGEPYRPTTMLSVLNYKGRDVAAAALRRVAVELEADLLELDAISLALIVGTYLGQTPYWPKGTMSTLGYAVAEISGRLATAAESADESEGTISFNIPVMNRLRSFPKRDIQSVLLGSSDERWEELKMNHALETLLGQIDAKRAASGQPSTAEQPVIVHVQDYIELNAVVPEVVQKLRAVVDKSWQKGKRIILLGSSSSDINDVSQWRSQLMEEISKEDCHVVPYHVDMPNKAAQQEVENVDENLLNIRTMLAALEGQGADAALDLFENKYKNMFPRRLLLRSETSALGTSVYGVQTVYRLASLLLDDAKDDASRGTRPLENCLRFLDMRDGDWTQQHPNVPLLHPRGLGTNDNPLPDSEKPKDASTGAPKANIQYNAHEKKLLSGLINAENIHTTFDDIVAPEKMKESIKALTSLSLIRPEAYTYGILKTERIPGLLLYGPPGTGKTLLAKAVAKESGANMLEVSAASIMDMYVGNSEKNVQALFSIARKLSPTIIFLDEGDALLGARTSGRSRNAHREVITQFLREWDGLTNTNKHAFIIVATNRPFDLDEAVLRRLPRKMLVDLPLKDEREAILRILLKEESLDETVSLSTLAAETDLYSGSDLKNLCVAAAMEAVKQEMRDYTAAGSPKEGYVWPEKRILTRTHFDAAIKEIGASINEDMESLQAIRKFDERYGDASNKQKRRKRSMGFDIVPPTSGTEAARVRTEDHGLAQAQVSSV